MTDRVSTPESGSEETEKKKTVAVPVRLKPADHSDHPVVSNYTSLTPVPGFVYLDFGFLEPSTLSGLAQSAKAGKAMPPAVQGRLAVRVACSYDVLQNLSHQIGQVLNGLKTSPQIGK
ncbi:hypothetical protein [Candidatus Nitrospira bockiana]